jgi:hypothetical protein
MNVDIGEGILKTGNLEAVPKFFVQQNSTTEILLNKVLKNNFKNGSYILELFDVDKAVTTTLKESRMIRSSDLDLQYSCKTDVISHLPLEMPPVFVRPQLSIQRDN